jgi:rubrerythrin
MKELSPYEIVEAVIHVEERGKEFYASAAALAHDAKTKSMLLFLAGQEQIHATVFRRILATAKFKPYEDSPEGEYAAFFRTVAREYVFTAERIAEAVRKGFASLDAALVFALSIEEDSVKTYRALREGIDGDASALDAVIKEEEQHCVTIAALRSESAKRSIP